MTAARLRGNRVKQQVASWHDWDEVNLVLDFGGISWAGVAAAAVACWVSGFVWFGPKTLFPVWWKAMGKRDDEVPGAGQNMGLVFGLVSLGAVLQAVVLAVLIEALAAGQSVSMSLGAQVGLIVGLAVVLPALGHRMFAGHGLKVWALECGNDLLNFVLMGAIYALVA